MNFLNCRLSIMIPTTFMDGEYVDLFCRNTKVSEGKVYPSRKVLHCNKIRSDYFVVAVQNVQNGEVPLSYLNKELKTLETLVVECTLFLGRECKCLSMVNV